MHTTTAKASFSHKSWGYIELLQLSNDSHIPNENSPEVVILGFWAQRLVRLLSIYIRPLI